MLRRRPNLACVAALFGAFYALWASGSNAQPAPIDSASPFSRHENIVEATSAANRYALDLDGIGIIVSYRPRADGGGVQPPDVCSRFVSEIVERGEQARCFLNQGDRGPAGYSVGFAYGLNGTGQLPPQQAARLIIDGEVVAAKRRDRRLRDEGRGLTSRQLE